ncbi:hypothetical protein Nepgr_004675 [Nepenthes gracilis]|uniref:Uncharacterized protein n=1 Tax=Nepenthes gracilis TaxID=150966 RepID=A0AAD3XFN1_NEPGR|nr:hypothetical protein Nepgr_004675 [Nepenthes gracilis]
MTIARTWTRMSSGKDGTEAKHRKTRRFISQRPRAFCMHEAGDEEEDEDHGCFSELLICVERSYSLKRATYRGGHSMLISI